VRVSHLPESLGFWVESLDFHPKSLAFSPLVPPKTQAHLGSFVNGAQAYAQVFSQQLGGFSQLADVTSTPNLTQLRFFVSIWSTPAGPKLVPPTHWIGVTSTPKPFSPPTKLPISDHASSQLHSHPGSHATHIAEGTYPTPRGSVSVFGEDVFFFFFFSNYPHLPHPTSPRAILG
jgi:hypothetical protein